MKLIGPERFWLSVFIVLEAGTLMLWACLNGCVAPRGRAATLDHNVVETTAEIEAHLRAELSAALVRIDSLENSVVSLRGNTVGGQGDSVTSWIREMVWGGLWVLAMIYYPCIHRPLRRRAEGQTV